MVFSISFYNVVLGVLPESNKIPKRTKTRVTKSHVQLKCFLYAISTPVSAFYFVSWSSALFGRPGAGAALAANALHTISYSTDHCAGWLEGF